MGLPDLSLAIVPHPIGGLSEGEVCAKADAVMEQIVRSLIVK